MTVSLSRHLLLLLACSLTVSVILAGDQTVIDARSQLKPASRSLLHSYLTKPGGEVIYSPDGCRTVDDAIMPTAALADTVWIHRPYTRFDAYVEQGYYNNNTPAIDDFLDKFEPRLDLLEAITLWTSERSNGSKLKIYINGWSGICYGGQFVDQTATTYWRFSDPLYMDDPYLGSCRGYYIENGQWQNGNTGELGDFWRFMGVAIHEITHAITPMPSGSNWLNEGWAVYYEYNILAMFGDINQETADYFISESAYPHWADYVANDYRWPSDGSWQADHDIQHSNGYGPPAWMLSMLRDPTLSVHWSGTLSPINWDRLYELWSHNYETFDKAVEIGGLYYDHYHSDIVIIDLISRTMGIDMYPIFRYDSPSGPGWGVRYWVPLVWYADLEVIMHLSPENPQPGQTFDLVATVVNTGLTDAYDFSVRFYDGPTLLDEQIVSVNATGSVEVTASHTVASGTHLLTVRVDEDELKLENNETNNEASRSVTFEPDCEGRVGDANNSGDDEPTIGDIAALIDMLFITRTEIACLAEGDINQSGGRAPIADDITIGDVAVLVDYLFITGTRLGLPDCF